MAMSRDEIMQQVQEVLVDALGVDDDEVTTEATLMGDLGAESIDFLAVSGMICSSFRDRFDILLEKRPSGIAELRYAMLYVKSQVRRRSSLQFSDDLRKDKL